MSDAIELLIGLAARASDERLRHLAGALGREQGERERLRLLLDYRAGYRTRFEHLAQQGITPVLLANYRQFLGRLDAAVDQQSGIVKLREEDVVRAREAQADADRRRKAFETVDARRQLARRLLADRRDQKQHDEFASQAAGRTPTGFGR